MAKVSVPNDNLLKTPLRVLGSLSAIRFDSVSFPFPPVPLLSHPIAFPVVTANFLDYRVANLNPSTRHWPQELTKVKRKKKPRGAKEAGAKGGVPALTIDHLRWPPADEKRCSPSISDSWLYNYHSQ